MLIGMAAFLLLLIALLAIPLTLQFQASSQKASYEGVRLRWAFGLVRLQISTSQSKADIRGGAIEKEADFFARFSRKDRKSFGALRQKKFRQRITRFIGDLWRAVSKKNLSLRVRIGLGDPAETGQLWAIVGPIAGLLAAVREASINIEPEFFDATFQVDTSGSIRFVPLRLIYLTSALLLSPVVWQGIWQMRGAER